MWYESEWTEKKGTTFEKHMFLTRWTKSCSLHRTSERQENCSFASVILFGVQFSMMSFDFSGTFALLSRSLFFSRCRCCSTKLCRNLYQFLSNNGTKCLHKRSYDWNGHWRWLMYFEFHLKKKRTNVRFCGRISYVNIFSSKNDYFSLYSQYKMSSGLGMKEKYGNILNA